MYVDLTQTVHSPITNFVLCNSYSIITGLFVDFQTAIDHLETEVVQYFSLVPNGVYTSEPLPSYHRMLLHSIVRYYSLDAMSK